MKYFHRIAENVPTMALVHKLTLHPELWNDNKFRTTFPNTPHADVDDILIHYSDTNQCDTTGKVMGDNNPIWHPAITILPEVKPLITGLMTQVGAYELGRVLISRLRPGKRVLPHKDADGSYVHTKDRARYHVCLQGLPGSVYRTGDETVCMRTGEVWWFNALEEHEVLNNSADDRIHLLIDVRIMP